MTRSSLHTRSFRRIHVSVVRYRLTENGFTGRKVYIAFEKLKGPWAVIQGCVGKSLKAIFFSIFMVAIFVL